MSLWARKPPPLLPVSGSSRCDVPIVRPPNVWSSSVLLHLLPLSAALLYSSHSPVRPMSVAAPPLRPGCLNHVKISSSATWHVFSPTLPQHPLPFTHCTRKMQTSPVPLFTFEGRVVGVWEWFLIQNVDSCMFWPKIKTRGPEIIVFNY